MSSMESARIEVASSHGETGETFSFDETLCQKNKSRVSIVSRHRESQSFPSFSLSPQIFLFSDDERL